MTKVAIDYTKLSTELESILERLQQPDVSVHEAVTLYEKGLGIAAQLETYLASAENTIEKLTLQADRVN